MLCGPTGKLVIVTSARRLELRPTWPRHAVPSQKATVPVGLLVSDAVAVTTAENVTLVVEEMAEVKVVVVPLA